MLPIHRTGRDLLLLLFLSDPDTNNSSNDDTSAFTLGITYVESFSDSTIQVELMIM